MLNNETLVHYLKDMTYLGKFSAFYCLELADFEGGQRWESKYNSSAVSGKYWDVISNPGWERED